MDPLQDSGRSPLPRHRKATPAGPCRAAVSAAIVGLCVSQGTISAQPSDPAGAPTPAGQQNRAEQALTPDQLASIDGRTFSGIDLRAALTPHALELSGVRATSWIERPPATAPPGIARTSKLLIEGDVRVRLGPYAFAASRAVMWAEPVRVEGPGGELIEADQIALYLVDASAGDPAAAPPDDDQPGDPLTGGGPSNPAQAARTSPAEVKAPGATTARHAADRLLVTALIPRRPVSLRADALVRGRPSFGRDLALLEQAERRLARHLRSLALDGRAGPIRDRPLPPDAEALEARGFEFADESFVDTRESVPEPPRDTVRIPRRGVFTFQADEITMVAGEAGESDALMITGGVGFEYDPLDRDGAVRLSADRAVVFLEPEAGLDASFSRLGVEDVAGVYLEGDVNVVATTTPGGTGGGRYQLRGSKVFYDPTTERATLLDAVFWTFDEERGMPLYVRAETIRQRSLDQWSAERATLSNVAFAEPHFAVGADSVTLTRLAPVDAPESIDVAAEGVTLRAGDVPVFYLPRIRGDFRPTAFRSLEFASRDGDAIVRTEWDMYTLLGLDAPTGNEASLLLDAYFERGPGIGADVSWDTTRATGSAFGYYIRDNGTDRLTTGARIDRNDEDRGMLVAESIFRTDGPWTIYAELAKISDPAFVDAFFEEQAETRREFASGVRVEWLEPNDRDTIVSGEVRATFDEFIANEYLLQSRGHQVERMPEVSLVNVAPPTPVPWLNYFGESSAGVLRFAAAENPVREQGFDTPRRSRAAFGLLPDESLEDALEARGIGSEEVVRLDSRHELQADLDAGPLYFTPYATGRVTAYDDGFRAFNDGQQVDDARLFGALGLRASTTFQHIDNSVVSERFGLRRMRHIIEPSINVWHGSANTDQTELPVFDESVESLATGTAMRLGVHNTWQTKRGPLGRERSVDWLTLDVDYVWSSSDTDRESPIGRFYDARPELSYLGTEFVDVESVWNATDAVAITGATQFDFDRTRYSYVVTGLQIDHGYGYTSFIEYRELDRPDLSLIAAGARYELTRKYAVELVANYDVETDDIRSLGAEFERRFPQWTLDVGIDLDDVRDSYGVSVSIRPVGFAGESRDRVFTEQFPRTGRASPNSNAPAAVQNDRLTSGPFGN